MGEDVPEKGTVERLNGKKFWKRGGMTDFRHGKG